MPIFFDLSTALERHAAGTSGNLGYAKLMVQVDLVSELSITPRINLLLKHLHTLGIDVRVCKNLADVRTERVILLPKRKYSTWIDAADHPADVERIALYLHNHSEKVTAQHHYDLASWPSRSIDYRLVELSGHLQRPAHSRSNQEQQGIPKRRMDLRGVAIAGVFLGLLALLFLAEAPSPSKADPAPDPDAQLGSQTDPVPAGAHNRSAHPTSPGEARVEAEIEVQPRTHNEMRNNAQNGVHNEVQAQVSGKSGKYANTEVQGQSFFLPSESPSESRPEPQQDPPSAHAHAPATTVLTACSVFCQVAIHDANTPYPQCSGINSELAAPPVAAVSNTRTTTPDPPEPQPAR